MKLYTKENYFTLYHGSMLDMLDVIEPNSIDSIITDPPYELGFMNKGWDSSGIAFQKETWEKCFAVLKSGAYLLAFGGSRTFHRIACAIEDAGFEIRDVIMWLYGSGFPKSMNIGKAIEGKVTPQEAQKWSGWGTALKPAYEPIIVARKPCESSCTDNVIKYGVGGINIDDCRIGDDLIKGGTISKMSSGEEGVCNFKTIGAERIKGEDHNGRFPANVILTYDETDFDEVCGDMPENEGNSASRYFYCAKASKKDRDEGLDEFEEVDTTELLNRKANTAGVLWEQGGTNAFSGAGGIKKNTHPTVKPTALMQYLVRLVSPKGATILDCFNGSGSTGKAVMYENKDRNANYKYIGIELTEEYLPIADARIRFAIGTKEIEQEKNSENQVSIFDLFKEGQNEK